MYIHTDIQTYVHTYVYMCIHTELYIYICKKCAYTCMHTYIHTCIGILGGVYLSFFETLNTPTSLLPKPQTIQVSGCTGMQYLISLTLAKTLSGSVCSDTVKDWAALVLHFAAHHRRVSSDMMVGLKLVAAYRTAPKRHVDQIEIVQSCFG